ncbi:disease resistance protein RPM1 [Beta vulgaris subsp. vulgaris]|uniref:disease resistance protein RPM1 n=1 Tax=Beta vulgaris subsp. vulgaris TaxID=3555 RepID=UPI0025491033|nr:disease resistance protein RPM1 [Beta vulgaris subsp. vulgaris]
MADTMLSFALEKLSTLITAEAELLGSLSDDVRKLQYELDSIKEVLKDAEKKAEVDNGVRVWLTQLRESAYHIEDVIDQYLMLKQQQQQQQQQQHSLQSDYSNSLKNQFLLIINKISKWVKSAVACITQLKPKHELSSEIKKILAGIVEINNRRERYKLITTTDDSSENEQNWQDPRISSLFKDESELFDFTRKKTQIFSWLNLEQQNDQDCTKIQGPRAVIAVVGMGGLGKTTLVRKVYEDKKVKEGFSVYAWVTVSQSYRWRDLLNSIFKQVQVEPSLQLDASDEHTIISKLRNHLQEKRYIVVFDDVWDSKLWVYVENALPNNKKCSRIMMTTREVDVGGAWNDPSGGHHLYKLEPLSSEASWDLFCHKTFGNANCPSQLEKLSQEMVGKCEGLPLAIVAIAGLLSTKEKILSEWNNLYNSFGFEIGSNPHFSNTTKILLFSYYKLPYYLKPCFLYFGMFPEDYIISSNRLVRLWIAENFIQNQRGKMLEEVAKEYLSELVNRSLIQVHEIDNPTERPQSRFRVHDILREIIILPKLDYLCFGQVLSENNSLTANKKLRRFSICIDGFNNSMVLEVFNNNTIFNSTRSLLWFSNLSEPYMSFLESCSPFESSRS